MHPEDDVARNIRNEQMADAMPSAQEAKAEHRNYLRTEGCAECDESDPNNLDTRYVPCPSCPAQQTPPDQTVVLCDECHEQQPSLREKAIQRARDRNERYDDPDRSYPYGNSNEGRVIAVVFFECEAWEYAYQPLIDDGSAKYPHPHARPVTPIECVCGANIDEIVKLSELDEEGDA